MSMNSVGVSARFPRAWSSYRAKYSVRGSMFKISINIRKIETRRAHLVANEHRPRARPFTQRFQFPHHPAVGRDNVLSRERSAQNAVKRIRAFNSVTRIILDNEFYSYFPPSSILR